LGFPSRASAVVTELLSNDEKSNVEASGDDPWEILR
jgi:hypothetical protein